MRRRMLGLAMAAVATGLLLVPAVAAQAATRFSDGFQDGNADGWTFTGGSWAVVSENSGLVLRQRATLAGVASAVANVTGAGSGFPTFVSAAVRPRSPL